VNDMAEKKAKTSKKVEELVEEISKLSVLELSELVNELQDKLGVTAAMPAATLSASPSATSSESSDSGQPQGSGGGVQTVVMTNAGGNKIAVIKALREINQNLTLIDAKNMTEAVPAEVLKDAKAEDAKSASEKLKAAGAIVELK
ncbi:MAG: ribosomal protein L7/L12, partial [Patescibacteria group bacterium]